MPDEVPESAETTQIAALRMADARSLHRADRAIFARRDARYRTERLAFLCGRQADGAAGRRGTRASRDRLLAVPRRAFPSPEGNPTLRAGAGEADGSEGTPSASQPGGGLCGDGDCRLSGDGSGRRTWWRHRARLQATQVLAETLDRNRRRARSAQRQTGAAVVVVRDRRRPVPPTATSRRDENGVPIPPRRHKDAARRSRLRSLRAD